jgi:hypothetical protein
LSIQGDIEAALIVVLEANISDLVAEVGARSIPQIEGVGRYAAVRKLAGSGDRIEFGQTDWNEDYRVTVYWPVSVDRDDSIDDWDAFSDALLADATLGESVTGLYDAYLSETEWGEAHEAHIRTMTATVAVKRVE